MTTFTAQPEHPLPHGLDADLQRFETAKAAYVELQERLNALVEGDQQLKQQADRLEAMADATEKSWREMARTPGVEQAEINSEIERCSQLRSEAQALRLTADARSGLKAPLILQLAEARFALRHTPQAINQAHWEFLLGQILGQEGMRDSLLQAFALTRSLYLARLSSDDSSLAHLDGQRQRQDAMKKGVVMAFANELIKLFDGEEDTVQAPALAALPRKASQEVSVRGLVELNRLRQSTEALDRGVARSA